MRPLFIFPICAHLRVWHVQACITMRRPLGPPVFCKTEDPLPRYVFFCFCCCMRSPQLEGHLSALGSTLVRLILSVQHIMIPLCRHSPITSSRYSLYVSSSGWREALQWQQLFQCARNNCCCCDSLIWPGFLCNCKTHDFFCWCEMKRDVSRDRTSASKVYYHFAFTGAYFYLKRKDPHLSL